MPYKTVRDAEKKNKGLTKYSEKAKKVWLEVFNETMEKHNDESRAFGSAYSVANKIDGRKSANMALRMQIKKKTDQMIKQRVEDSESGDKSNKTKERAKKEYKEYKKEHPKTKKSLGDFVKKLFKSGDETIDSDKVVRELLKIARLLI
jgi:hypothetical protein